MLIIINKKCEMGCNHCMTDCKPTDTEEISLDTMKKIITYANSVGVMNLILSGGEPLLHSKFFEILEYTKNNFKGLMITITTSGLPLNDLKMRNKLYEILSKNKNIVLQLTNDKRFYKKEVEVLKDEKFKKLKNVIIINSLTLLINRGRAKQNNLKAEELGLRKRNSPSCFNSRSSFKFAKNINEAVRMMEMKLKYCCFGFDYNGNFFISECLKSYGNIDELISDKTIIEKRIIKDFKPCNECGDCETLEEKFKKYIEKF